MHRRSFLTAVAGACCGLLPIPRLLRAAPRERLTKPIPGSGEQLPLIGMGTWITFNVGNDPQAISERAEVLRAFFAAGGGMIDSSPMYGSAEAVVGETLARLGGTPGLFAATKVWTGSGADGPREIAESQRLWGVERFDLLQVHNVLAWREHLATLRDMKADGRLRYLGLTTSHGRRHAELEQIMRSEPIDFVQVTYNIADREAEDRLLPLAAERGIAVIANRPFRRGELLDVAQRHPLPGWAADIGCTGWPQVLLKFIVSHPAVTCTIPATSQVAHMQENMAAGVGPLPDSSMRRRMAADFAAL